MTGQKRHFLLACSFILAFCGVQAQVNLAANHLIYSTDDVVPLADTSSSLFTIKGIIVTGNKRTKNNIIFRELAFQKNERYPLDALVEKFSRTKQQLMNTGLFRSVVVSLKSLQGYDVYVAIDLKERWYIYPMPFVKVVDRSFNEWIVKKGMSLDRVNYGIKLTHKNTTGRNDRLHLNFVNGFTKQVAIRYDNLFLDNDLQWSSNFSVAFGKNHEVNYNTINDKQVAYKNNDEYVHSFFRTMLEFSYRRAIKTRHTFGIGYNYEDVADTLFHLNPSYSDQQKVIRYPEIFYNLRHFNVDLIPYPTRGYVADLSLVRKGFSPDLNLWQLTAKGSGYWPLSDKFFFNLRLAGMIKVPFQQTYVTKQLLGYGDLFLQGYEYDVIDGVAGGYGKGILTRQIINTAIRIPSKRIERLNHIPIAVYAKVYGNTGYVYDPEPGYNLLSNRLLYSGGIGLDFVLFTDLVFKLEWSTNQLGQKGIYLHRRDYF